MVVAHIANAKTHIYGQKIVISLVYLRSTDAQVYDNLAYLEMSVLSIMFVYVSETRHNYK